jgi:5-methylcytosine-specific restriction endonuclease McrA
VKKINISLLKENPDNPRTKGKQFFGCLNCRKVFYSPKLCKSREPKYCSRECLKSDKFKAALSAGRKASDKCKGPNLYNWKGGKETEAVRMKVSAHKRRSAQSITINQGFLQSLLSAQNNQCFYCEGDLSEYKAIEHLTPLSRGGDNQPYNLVYSCKSCNSKKRQNTLEEFAIKNNTFHLLDKFDLIFSAAIYG